MLEHTTGLEYNDRAVRVTADGEETPGVELRDPENLRAWLWTDSPTEIEP